MNLLHDISHNISRVPATWTATPLVEGNPYSSSCTLLSLETRHIVIDTGLSLQEGELRSALRRHRVSPHDVELVINTHLHVDHCGNNCLFEHAAIAMSRREWDWTDRFYSTIFASSTPERAALEFYPELPAHNFKTRTIRNVARLARMFWRRDRLGAERRFVWLEETPLPPGLEILQTPGHTPYHVSILVNGSQPVLVAGDAVLHEDPGFSVRTMIPYSEELFLSTREQLLARRLPTIPGHGPLFEP